MSKARVFYVLLDNFRNRTYISEDDKVLRMQHTSRTTASQKPRRASSVPALSISRLNKRLSTVTDSTAQTKSERLLPIIAIDNVSVSPEEYQRDEISTTEAMLRGYTSPRGNKFDPRIEDKENDPSCAGKPTRRRSVKIKAFAQKLKGLFGSEISNNSRREGSEEHSKPTTTPNRPSLLQRSVGYHSLRQVPASAISLPPPSFPTKPNPDSPQSRFEDATSPNFTPASAKGQPATAPTRIPFSPITNEYRLSPALQQPARDPPPHFILNTKSVSSAFSDDSAPDPSQLIDNQDPPSPTPLKRRPSPLCLSSAKQIPVVCLLSSSSSTAIESPLLSALTTSTPAESLFLWSPAAVTSPLTPLSGTSYTVGSVRTAGTMSMEAQRVEVILKERERELDLVKAENLRLRAELEAKYAVIERLTAGNIVHF